MASSRSPAACAGEGSSVWRLAAFAAISASIHTAAFVVAGRRANPSPMTFDTASQTLAGDTLAVDQTPAAPPDDDFVDPSTTATPTATTAMTATATATTTTTATPTPTRLSSSSARRSAGLAAAATSAPPALYGAVGEHLATDLATTFTRAFPQAASADPVWSSVPFGAAGRAEISLTLDDAGHLTDSDIRASASPSPALRRSIERTIALLSPRSFTARGAVTRLRVTAHVSRDDLHDGWHGDVFALSAGSFSGEVGAAFFALPPGAGPGRRVDVEVRLLP